LHWAVISPNVELEDIRAIAASDLELVKQHSGNGVNPCHLAVTQPSMQIIRCLEDFFPLFATSTPEYDELPIHFAARYSNDKHMIEYLLQCDPSSTKKRTFGSATPLHLACQNKTKGANQVFDALLEVDADPVRMRDGSGRAPLYLACEGHLVEPEHVVASLLVAYPKGAALADFDGTFAIHVAANTRPQLCSIWFSRPTRRL